ncbi:MAG: histidine kinase, partial [Microcella sp.]|nr:histidine kinase [Microcella sp.]
MSARRGWSTAVMGTAVLLAVFLAVAGLPLWRVGLGAGALAIVIAGWFTFGIARADDPRGSPAFVAVTILAVGLATSVYPSLAILQALAYPVAWMFMPTFRRAVLANLLVALAVTLGLIVSLGTELESLARTALTVGISLAFSLAMGCWIGRMMALGDERGRLLAELQGAQTRIAALNRDAGATADREHLARELHDTIAQDLTGLVMLAQRARRELGDVETLRMIEENARATLAETRALVASSAALGENETDLTAALHRLAARFSRETGVDVECEVTEAPALNRDAEVVVLRCVQEALGNARKHARA